MTVKVKTIQEAYRRVAGACRAMGAGLERIGENVDRGLAALDQGWEGNARRRRTPPSSRSRTTGVPTAWGWT